MANKRPKPEEIVSKLRQVEVLMGQVMYAEQWFATADIVKHELAQHSVSVFILIKLMCRFMRVNSPIIHMRLRVVVQVPHASVQTVEQRCFGT